MTTPVFSILIPVYNAENYLPVCLDSIFQQKNSPEFEVIAVDDASHDSSPAILKKYKKKYPHLTLLIKDKNEGTYQARKDAVSIARGKHLIFIDSDDTIFPDFFNRAYQAVLSGNYDIIQFQTEQVQGLPRKATFHSTKYPDRTVLEGSEILDAFFNRKLSIPLWAKVFNAEFVKAHELENPPDCYGEDSLRSTILAIHAKKYLYLHDKVYHYNYGAGVGGQSYYTLQQFERFCKNAISYDIIQQEMMKEKLPPVYLKYLNRNKFEMLKNQILPVLKNKIPQESMNEAINIACRYWGKELVLLYLRSDLINTGTSLKEFLQIVWNYCRIFSRRWFLRLTGKISFRDAE